MPLPVLYQKNFTDLREQCIWPNKVIITELKEAFASPLAKNIGQSVSYRGVCLGKFHIPNSPIQTFPEEEEEIGDPYLCP